MSTDPHEILKELSLRFVMSESELGFTFASVAATRSTQGRVDRAREVRAKGEQAYQEAERRLVDDEQHGWDIADLPSIQQVIAHLGGTMTVDTGRGQGTASAVDGPAACVTEGGDAARQSITQAHGRAAASAAVAHVGPASLSRRRS